MSHAKVPAVVMGLATNALGLVRSLGRQLVPVYAFDHVPEREVFYSKYARSYICPNPETQPDRLLKYLKKFRQKVNCRPVLFPTSDEYVMFVSNNIDQLGKDFEIIIANPQVQANLVSKSRLPDIAMRVGIPCPQTYIIKSLDELIYASEGIPYPCVMKPAYSPSWHRPEMRALIGPKKVIQIDTMERLIHWYKKIAFYDPKIVIQELIPGKDDRLCYVASYWDRNSRMLGAFAGRKIRVTPIHFGSASFVETVYDPTLLGLNRKLLGSVKYRGLAGVEFKSDPRDGKYKLIEVNARWGLWDALGAYCGVNLGYMAYLDAIGQKVAPVLTYAAGKKWFSLDLEIFAFLQYRREESLNLRDWLGTLSFRMMHAYFAWEDFGPSLKVIRRLVDRFFHHGFKYYLSWKKQ